MPNPAVVRSVWEGQWEAMKRRAEKAEALNVELLKALEKVDLLTKAAIALAERENV